MKLMGDKGLVRAYNRLMSVGTVFAFSIVSEVCMALVAGVKTRVLKMLAVDKRTMTGLAGGTMKTQCHFTDSHAYFSLPAGLDVRKKKARLLINSRRDGQAQPKKQTRRGRSGDRSYNRGVHSPLPPLGLRLSPTPATNPAF
jgi:hypothetical protein